MFCDKHEVPIAFVQASDCLFFSIISKNPALSQQEILAQAYKNGILDIKKNYLSYCFYQNLNEEYYCFFVPSSFDGPVLLDLTLPIYLKEELCCIFLSSKNYFCFYQNHRLVFCREFEGSFDSYLEYLRVFFDYKVSEIYCLSSLDGEQKLQALKGGSPPIIPLLSFLDLDLGFTLSSIQTSQVLPQFINLNSQTQNFKINEKKVFFGLIGGCLGLFLCLALCLFGYQIYLEERLDKLNQNISSSAFLSPIEEIRYFQNKNQETLNALALFGESETQKLFFLAEVLRYLNLSDVLRIEYQDEVWKIKLARVEDLSRLLEALSAYRCKTSRDGESLLLEISKI